MVHIVHGYAFPAARNVFQSRLYLALEWLGARITDAQVLLKQDALNLAKEVLHAPEDRLHLPPNGVNVERYAPRLDVARKLVRWARLGLDDDCVAIGMVGRLW